MANSRSRTRATGQGREAHAQRESVDCADRHLDPSHDHGILGATTGLGGGLVEDVVVVVAEVPRREVDYQPDVNHGERCEVG